MGGWLMILAALARPEKIKAMVGIAAAPDFTQRILWEKWSDAQRETLIREKCVMEPSGCEEPPYPITLQFMEESKNHYILQKKISLNVPIRLLHGMEDDCIPYQESLTLAQSFTSQDVDVILRKKGDHRMSSPEDIMLIFAILEKLL